MHTRMDTSPRQRSDGPRRRGRLAGCLAGWLIAGLTVLWASTAASIAGDDLRLVDLVKAGDAAAVGKWIRGHIRDRNAEIDQPAADGTTALHWAADAGHREIVALLLAAGANPNAVSRLGVPPLLPAVSRGDAAMTGAMLAARTGDVGTITALLDHGAHVNASDATLGETALMWAAAENHAEAVHALMVRGADVNARSTVMSFSRDRFGDGRSARFTVLPRGGWTPLMYAARQNAPEAARALAEAGADLNARDPDGTPALVLAVINAHYDLAALLLEQGADPNVADAKGMTALYAAVDMNTLDETPGRPAPVPSGRLAAGDIIGRLLAKGAKPDAPLSSPILERVHNNSDGALDEGATALMRAARKGDVASMRALLDHGANPRARSRRGATAAMYLAGFGGQLRFAEYDTQRATDADFVAGLRLLLDRGARFVDERDEAGQTALHFAVSSRGLPVIAFLVEHGARPDEKDAQGRTPLDLAQGVGARARGGAPAAVRADVVDLLRRSTAASPVSPGTRR
jgi:ankyrin repeat protein